MSSLMNDKVSEKIQENLEKITQVVQDNVSSSSDYCKDVCDSLKGENRTVEEQKLWDKCGCVD
jgi:hypothetical protein